MKYIRQLSADEPLYEQQDTCVICGRYLPEGSGMSVTTSNITWCTGEMYISALATAGITDARIVVAAPFEVSGTAKFTSPVFEITLTNDAAWAAGDSIQVVKGEGRIILSGTPTFIPETPGEGLLWDDSTFATDGTLRVIADPTGIDNTEWTIDKSQWTIYDLTGRRITEIVEKGIYIVNGKKMIFK